MQSLGSFRVTKTVQAVCPTGSLIAVSGCSNCKIGCTALITLKSNCFPGLAKLSVVSEYVNLLTNSIYLSAGEQNYTIAFHTTQISNSFSLVIGEGEAAKSFDLSFQAPEDVKIDTEDNQQLNSASISAKTSDFFTGSIPGFFDGALKGTLSWWKYLIFALIIVGAIILVIILFPYLLKAIRSIVHHLSTAFKTKKYVKVI